MRIGQKLPDLMHSFPDSDHYSNSIVWNDMARPSFGIFPTIQIEIGQTWLINLVAYLWKILNEIIYISKYIPSKKNYLIAIA